MWRTAERTASPPPPPSWASPSSRTHRSAAASSPAPSSRPSTSWARATSAAGEPRFTGDNAVVNAALLEPIRKIAKARGATLAQIALAWVQQRAQVHGLAVVPIPGTRTRARIEQNTGATRIELSADELAALEPIAGQVAGARYADMSATSAGQE